MLEKIEHRKAMSKGSGAVHLSKAPTLPGSQDSKVGAGGLQALGAGPMRQRLLICVMQPPLVFP